MSSECPTCPGFPPAISQVSWRPSSVLLPHQISLNSVCRTHEILPFRDHCFCWCFRLEHSLTLEAASLSFRPPMWYTSNSFSSCKPLPSYSMISSQTPCLAILSRTGFLIRSRIMLISLVIITIFSCDVRMSIKARPNSNSLQEAYLKHEDTTYWEVRL